MAICYINQTIEIPNIKSIDFNPEIAGDMARTAGNKLRYDVSTNATKEGRSFQAIYLTLTQFDSIYNYLKSINFGFTYFWVDEYGGTAAANSIIAKINNFKAQRVQFGTPLGWENNGKNISFDVIEQ